MNAGFSSLTKAKALLLPAALRTRADWDEAIIALGLAVGEMIEGHCARKFAYAVEDTLITDANRLVISVPRYPVKTWNALDMQSEPGSTWEDASGNVARYEDASGLIHFRQTPGGISESLRVTYTGGFWWSDTEDASGEAPEGAALLPAALSTACLLQMQAIAQAQDLFGTMAGKPQSKGQENTQLLGVHLVPAVERMINHYRRFAA